MTEPKYSIDKNTLRTYESVKGGINNLLVISTSPADSPSFQITSDTIITTGNAAKKATVERRHQYKLNRANRGKPLYGRQFNKSGGMVLNEKTEFCKLRS